MSQNIKEEAKRINRRISRLWCDDATVMRKLCQLYEEWLYNNKYEEFEYKVIAPKGFGVYVLFRMEEEYMMTDKEFCEFVGENIENYITCNDTEIAKEYLEDVRQAWGDGLKSIEKRIEKLMEI